MSQQRYSGKLKKWNAERGFGFIMADDGGQDIFVHITAFARDGRQPTEGEALTFEVEPDRNGKRSAAQRLDQRWILRIEPAHFFNDARVFLFGLARKLLYLLRGQLIYFLGP